MEHFWDKLADAVISQTGTLGIVLVGIILYLGWQLARERERNERDREQAKKEAAEHARAFDALAESNRAIGMSLAKMEGFLTGRRGE